MHARQQIRERFASILTGLATTQNRVYPSRVIKWSDKHIPGIAVYTTDDDTLTDESVMGGIHVHDLEVIVEARVVAADGYDDQLDGICAEIETAIFATHNLNGLVKQVQLLQTEIEFSGDNEDTHTAMAELSFSVWYRINESDPTTIIP